MDGGAKITRRYRPNTLILETRFETADGAVTVIDFMPPREGDSRLIRLVIGERGQRRHAQRTGAAFRLRRHRALGDAHRRRTRCAPSPGPTWWCCARPRALHGENYKTVGEFTVAAGETMPFVLSYSLSHQPLPEPVDAGAALRKTEAFWAGWAGKNQIDCPWNEAVRRSLITLKALTYGANRRHGGGADHLAAGSDRRAAQLGLPLLLAARRDAHAAGADERRLLRGGADVARLAVARCRRQPEPDPDHVRHRAASGG